MIKYVNDKNCHTMKDTFDILKKDVPFELAKYIKEKVVDSSRRGYYSTWNKDLLDNHYMCVIRHRRMYRTDHMLKVKHTNGS